MIEPVRTTNATVKREPRVHWLRANLPGPAVLALA
jgi:hypothetical protein